MKATIVGAKVSEAELREACTKADVPPDDLRLIGGRVWVELPHDVRDSVVDGLVTQLGVTVTMIVVELPLGMHGQGLQAWRSTYRGPREDVSEAARETLSEWLADTPEGSAFDQDVAASDLAWDLIEDEAPASAAQPNHDQAWARAILERMVTEGSLELHGSHPPVDEIAPMLQYASRGIETWLAERLLDKLISSSAVDEVFVDAGELAKIARETRPMTRER